jgi:7,8-dihydropterin-6-yl-methyl-4-(beta-D-ribofuranosyl)aminobenzene 5'-phosphate synthase
MFFSLSRQRTGGCHGKRDESPRLFKGDDSQGDCKYMKQAQRMTGMEKVHAVLGGFHLAGAKPEVIQKTIADIKAIRLISSLKRA